MAKLRSDESARRLYMSYIDDGVIDMFAGWTIFFAGLMMFTDMVWMAGASVAIFLPIVWSVKETVTMPRVRLEEVDRAASRRTGRMLIGFLIAGLLVFLLGLVVFLLIDNPELTTINRDVVLYGAAGLVGLTVLGLLVVVGAVHRAPRWYVYAIAVTLFASLAWVLKIGLPWLLIASGVMMIVTGTVYMIRFLRNHPVLPEEERPAW